MHKQSETNINDILVIVLFLFGGTPPSQNKLNNLVVVQFAI